MSCKKTLVGLLSLISLATITSCGNKEESTTTEKTSEQEFVAVTSSSWDAEVTVGSFKYQFDLILSKDNTLSFSANCVSKVQTQQGGGGFPGFGENSNDAGQTSEEEIDLATKNFTFTGSWQEETGYGYILNFQDSKNTVIHTDFNTIEGRHQFYYLVEADDSSATVLFQAKDSNYRKQLAADYKTWDERDSTYIFEGKTTGNNNSVATAYLYCHSDNSAVFNTASGSDRKVTLGLSWEIKDNKFILKDGNTTYTGDSSINTSHPGYRVSYSSTALFASTLSSVESSELSNEDFDGTTLYQFTGSYTTEGPDGGTKNVELNLTDNANKMYLYSAGMLSKQGTYTFENEVFNLSFEGEETVTVSKVDSKYTYTFQIVTSGFFGGTSTIDVELTYIPEA